MMINVAEVRDWLAFAGAPISLYVSWRWRRQDRDQQPHGRHHVLELSDSVTVSDSLTIEAIRTFEPTPMPDPGTAAARWLSSRS